MAAAMATTKILTGAVCSSSSLVSGDVLGSSSCSSQFAGGHLLRLHTRSTFKSVGKLGVQSRLQRDSVVNASSSLGFGDGLIGAFGGPLGGAMATQAPAMASRSAEADVMGLLLRQRIVFLGHQMDDFVADSIVSQLLLLDAVDPTKDIRLFVNCPGGSISAAMAIYDSIQLCRANVSTIVFGLAASTAAIVVAGGSKGKRFAMPNARIMMHQPLGGASGQAIDVEIQAKEIMYHKTNVTRIISEITGRSTEQVAKDIDRDRYMSPVEAMEYGLLDGVIDQDTIMPLAPNVERVKSRSENLAAMEDPLKFLNPEISDDEIY
ncbi:ATP-dependent Clp protease, protease subunit [Marchantia polymorpha subsp. ruderalis]|uniref:ATP-dependent Clp protease proteolytic subunit n=2 Tax=Marchantia polymorpha TaxID=3197 RepID=A0A176VID4_MARPO|nr:hypothetical protein AXG93_154s1140 [Marchantia polymorpha subsp. ruderalis]PTQ44574.1 hypothetical protein MARPO_0019s0016 [Marchantia polymorpha]BBM98307.1 hypothetical protein Mp_1g12460 [Marchantia polymorpha subsp. ruderalis]|eukprot:PTQ44574.1 hypothetical protein MARPO_0019s0016 [Marchantia polymorpha]